MRIVPAIDLMGGRAVRLRGGRREEATVYSDEPWTVAEKFGRAGATLVHIVDLDGAFAGARRQAAVLERVVRAARVPLQIGGGVRTAGDVTELLVLGAAFVVLGTAAVKEPALVELLCGEHPGRIVVAVDARDGRVAVEGWTQTADVTAVELAGRAASWGAAKILYTDVARDGLRTGPNVRATAELAAAVPIPVIASGGIGSLGDLRALAAAGVAECVVGRALYEGVFTLEEALEEALSC
jgi:phosphoribosylformimino-5-aminoimidazole carboxamide ribotide isomerase